MSTWWGFHGAMAAPLARNLPVAQFWTTPAHREWAARLAAVVADRGFAILRRGSANRLGLVARDPAAPQHLGPGLINGGVCRSAPPRG